MFITFEDDKSMVKEEIKPTGDGARSERQEQPEWRYHLTMNTAEVVIGDALTLRPDWYGPMSPEEIRAAVRMASAAPALYDACKAMQKSLNGSATDFAGMLRAHRQLDAAVALVDGNRETK